MGDFGGIHKSTASRVIRNVTSALLHHRNRFIYFPVTDNERQATQQQFYNIARLPRVIGALDCTHIKIVSPGGNNAENFRNRKGFFSLNVQAVCNANYELTDVVARWPGSSHDSNIFDNSNLRMRFEAGEMGNGLLLGDGGYPVRSYLITPLNNPQNATENLFNESQIRTRNVIERTFGIWKRRFPILSVGMRCKIPFVQDIIVATAILHNIGRRANEPVPDNLLDCNDNVEHVANNVNDNNNDRVRKQLLEYFGTL